MKRRLYFILPDIPCAKKVHNELLLACVGEGQMHVIAKDGMNLKDLPAANLLQKSDIVHGTQLGLTLGGLTGMVLGSLAAFYPLSNTSYGGLAVLIITLAGAFIGAWASSMIAINIPNTRLQRFQKDIQAGHVLFMLEVPVKRVEEITEMIKEHHSEADFHGIEPTIPAFP